MATWAAAAPDQPPAVIAADAPPAPGEVRIVAPAQATAILTLDEIRPGMKGYGLSVFHGSKIEPFAVEVVSVMRDFAPKKSVIWIRCPEERMQLTGPVEGMSGSPIFLWTDDDHHPELGRGGRLIGAFAFGYGLSKDCYVGVQPIAQMRQIADEDAAAPRNSATISSANLAPAGDWARARPMLREMLRQAELTPQQAWRMQALLDVLPANRARLDDDVPAAATVPAPANAGAWDTTAVTQARPLVLPVAIPSAKLAALFAPWLAQSGLGLAAGPAAAGNAPPAYLDPATIRIEPGSTLAIPLAWGDLDLSAVGTVTDVLPDGRVLGFGHPMFGQGDTALPLAGGFVHFVQPNLSASFKLAGSTGVCGSIYRDEGSGVLGAAQKTFTTAPVRVVVHPANRPTMEYHYQVAIHRQLTPILAAVVAAQSAVAQVDLPDDNTVHLRGHLDFTGGRRLDLNITAPQANAGALAMNVMMPIAMLAQNPFASVALENLDLEVTIEPTVRQLTLLQAYVPKGRYRPGDQVPILLQLQPHQGPVVTRRLDFPLPPRLPDGDYTLMVCDGPTYQAHWMQAHPYLGQITNVDELFTMLQEVTRIPDDTLYVTMMLPTAPGLAVNRVEMPQLPSSRRAMLSEPAGAMVTPLADWWETSQRQGSAVQGSANITIRVQHDPPTR